MAVAPMVERCVSVYRGFFAVFVIHNGKKKGKFRSFSRIGRNLGFTPIKTAPFDKNQAIDVRDNWIDSVAEYKTGGPMRRITAINVRFRQRCAACPPKQHPGALNRAALSRYDGSKLGQG